MCTAILLLVTCWIVYLRDIVCFSVQGKMKAEKKRHKAEEQLLKATHAQRQEAAQARREEKKRAEKERLMNEEDPDKARKLEVRPVLANVSTIQSLHSLFQYSYSLHTIL